jgi:hypothetical protein
MTEPRAANPERADTLLRTYRSDHRIVAVGPEYDESCEVCMVPVYRIRHGYRHSNTEIKVLMEKAPIGYPREK